MCHEILLEHEHFSENKSPHELVKGDSTNIRIDCKVLEMDLNACRNELSDPHRLNKKVYFDFYVK